MDYEPNLVVYPATPSLYGGTIDKAESTIAPELFTGNTLNVWNHSGTAVHSVQNFEFYNFVLPASLQVVRAISGLKAGVSDHKGIEDKYYCLSFRQTNATLLRGTVSMGLPPERYAA